SLLYRTSAGQSVPSKEDCLFSRTLLQANLAGLFPDQCSAAADGAPQLPACYLPIHTVPKPTDQLLKMSSPCPAYTRHWREFKLRPDGPYASAGRRFAWLAERARVGTGGWRQGEPLGISELGVWRSLGLKLPDWVDHDVIAGLEELRHLKFAWKFSEPKLYGSRIGALIARLVGDMEARLAGGEAIRILQVYSAHDSTVSAFLSAFGVFNNLQPPLAACAMLELYSDGEVRLFYRNATTTTNSSLSADPPLPMLIPFCQKPCLLSQLAKQMRKRGAHSDSGESMCELATDSSVSKTTVTTDSSSNAIFIVLFGLILCLAITLVITCWLWNKERQLRLEFDSNMFANHISKTKDC
uniref:Lysosomal acid phosphatase n=1 Tax=Macrostomum lignano TaxID=282301 RepID=A0A1I8J3D6_9PLAT